MSLEREEVASFLAIVRELCYRLGHHDLVGEADRIIRMIYPEKERDDVEVP